MGCSKEIGPADSATLEDLLKIEQVMLGLHAHGFDDDEANDPRGALRKRWSI
jgi:hypothetical protein